MRKISSRSRKLVGFLPTQARFRESQFQYCLNPVRCQRTTVSGWTRIKALRHPGHSRRRVAQNNRSGVENRGFGWRRARTSSCCRSARFSKRRSWRARTERTSTRNRRLSVRGLSGLYHRKHNGISPDGILTRHYPKIKKLQKSPKVSRVSPKASKAPDPRLFQLNLAKKREKLTS